MQSSRRVRQEGLRNPLTSTWKSSRGSVCNERDVLSSKEENAFASFVSISGFFFYCCSVPNTSIRFLNYCDNDKLSFIIARSMACFTAMEENDE